MLVQNHPSIYKKAQHSPRFSGNSSSSLVNKSSNRLSTYGQDVLTKTLTEEYLKKLLETSEAKKVLEETLSPEYVKKLIESSELKKTGQDELEKMLSSEYVKKLIESSELKKTGQDELEKMLTEAYLLKLIETSNLKKLTKEQITQILEDEEFKDKLAQNMRALACQALLPSKGAVVTAGIVGAWFYYRNEIQAATTKIDNYLTPRLAALSSDALSFSMQALKTAVRQGGQFALSHPYKTALGLGVAYLYKRYDDDYYSGDKIFKAVESHDIERLKKILKRHPINSTYWRPSHNHNLLHEASNSNYTPSLEHLLAHEKKRIGSHTALSEWVNTINKDGYTPLGYATEKLNPENVSLLLKYGADPNLSGTYRRRPLNIALKHRQGTEEAKNKIVEMLKQAGGEEGKPTKYDPEESVCTIM